MKTNISREKYLQEIWSRYPEMPASARASGRVEALEMASGLQLRLFRGDRSQSLSFAQVPENAEILRVGDLIAVVGEKIILLAPALEKLPRAAFESSRQKQWNSYLASLRSFFNSKNFLEVRTPSLVISPGTEPSLDVFSTEFKIGSYRQKFFLPTSPELHLKKLLSLGAEKIFEIAVSYRNGEITERHQPEFLMLEWYRAYDSSSAIKNDVENLVHYLAEVLHQAKPVNVRHETVASLFRQFCDFTLTPQTTAEELISLAARLGIDVHSAESIDDYFFLIFMECIESRLPEDDLIFVDKYPPYQAALARLTEDGWGDRFEVYWKGLELANAFHELNDPTLQRARFDEDLKKKKQMGKEEVFIDEEFLQCLEAGMPPSAGIALGVERLFMALHDLKNIGDLRLFPLEGLVKAAR